MAESKYCFRCREPKPLTDYPKDKRRPGGHAATCRVCANLLASRNYKKKRLEHRLKTQPGPMLRLENNLLAIQILIEAWKRAPKAYISAWVHLEGAEFPINDGIEIRAGKSCPLLVYQGHEKLVQKHLGLDSVFSIAQEMDICGIEIVWKSLPALNPDWPLTKALLARRRKVSQNDVIGGHNEQQIKRDQQKSSELDSKPEDHRNLGGEGSDD